MTVSTSVSPPDSADRLLATLRQHFGLPAFRPGQREMIEAVLARRDALCIMPTGSGKSLCYQLPGMMLEGVTLVVSPLIALMADQVNVLQARGLPVSFVNSSLTLDEQESRLAATAAGQFKILFIAPERFSNSRFNAALDRVKVSLFAVDEAHCISEWGHDFRPAYRRLQAARDKLGRPPTLALTATATPFVREDICHQLCLQTPFVLVTGFDRPNLTFEVVRCTKGEKEAALERVLRELDFANDRRPGKGTGSAIIYVATKRVLDDLAALLTRLEITFVLYHGTLMPDERKAAQNAFMSGKVKVAVATNAFGMGVDKADVRAVIHYHLPGSVEAYYQEAGRAGRDGLPARCVLLFSEGDRHIQEFFIEGNYPARETVAEVYEYLRLQPDAVEAAAARVAEHVTSTSNKMAVDAAIRLLDDAGIIFRAQAHHEQAALRFNDMPDARQLITRLPARAGALRAVLTWFVDVAANSSAQTVFFRTEEIAHELGYSVATVQDTIHQLKEMTSLEYTPAYRGSRAHMLKPDLDPHKLPIDFKTLAHRERLEREKLETLLTFARNDGCRRRKLLTYFGEKGVQGNCSTCDYCKGGGRSRKREQAPAPPRRRESRDAPPPMFRSSPAVNLSTEETFTLVRKVLACVARVEEAGKRVGKTMIRQILLGSKRQEIGQMGLDKLSTYGLLKDLEGVSIDNVMEQLLAGGCLKTELVSANRPVITLTERGWRVMQAKEQIDIILEAEAPARPERRVPAPNPQGNYRNSLELHLQGKPIAAIANERSLAESTIEGHLERCVREGLLTDIRPFVTEKLEATLRRLFQQHPDLGMKALLEHCPLGTTYFQMRCVYHLMRREMAGDSPGEGEVE